MKAWGELRALQQHRPREGVMPRTLLGRVARNIQCLEAWGLNAVQRRAQCRTRKDCPVENAKSRDGWEDVEASLPGHGGKQKSRYRYGYSLSQAFAVTLDVTTQWEGLHTEATCLGRSLYRHTPHLHTKCHEQPRTCRCRTRIAHKL